MIYALLQLLRGLWPERKQAQPVLRSPLFLHRRHIGLHTLASGMSETAASASYCSPAITTGSSLHLCTQQHIQRQGTGARPDLPSWTKSL